MMTLLKIIFAIMVSIPFAYLCLILFRNTFKELKKKSSKASVDANFSNNYKNIAERDSYIERNSTRKRRY